MRMMVRQHCPSFIIIAVVVVLPIFEAIMDDVKGNKSKALCMFPLKALVNDRLIKMTRIARNSKYNRRFIPIRLTKR